MGVTLEHSDISLAANIRRIATLVQGWPGEVIDRAAAMRAIRPEDPQPPIYWCFNSTAEFPALADALGPGQPLVGMRSLNQIIRVSGDLTRVLDDLAAYYADSLLARFGRRPCVVGGNCQSAAIAWRVAIRLMAAGVPVLRLVCLDAEPHVPYPGAVRLLFGADSHAYNPTLRPPEDPARPVPWHWERAWRRPEVRVVPGGHGKYFQPANLPGIAAAILSPDPQAVPAKPDLRARQAIRFRATLTTADAILIEAEVYPKLSDLAGLSVLPLWLGAGGGLLRVAGPDWVVPIATRPFWRGRFPRPDGGGDATLHLVPCAPGIGPLDWPACLQPSVRTELTWAMAAPKIR